MIDVKEWNHLCILADEVRRDFPILSQTVYGRPLIYLDNAATTQLPRQVLSCLEDHYVHFNGNVHRGSHWLSSRSTQDMEAAREKVRSFLCADGVGEVIFTGGTTAAINMVAQGFLRHRLGRGDAVVVTALEHHSNYVPWQQICKEKGAEFRVVPAPGGELDQSALDAMLDDRVKLLAVTQVSNLTGTVVDTGQVVALAHQRGIPVLIDAAQAMRHMRFDLRALPADFLCFSGHKMMAPAGIGVLFIRANRLSEIHPSQFGGGMVDRVTNADTSFAPFPFCMEAGTPNYPGIIALGTAIDYLNAIGIERIAAYEDELLEQLEADLRGVDGIKIVGRPRRRAGVISIAADGVEPFDLAGFLDKYGIALRSGSHCAQPILDSLDLRGTLRISPAFYNTVDEIDAFIDKLQVVLNRLRRVTETKL